MDKFIKVKNPKIIIFDLDGTLADINQRRKAAINMGGGKIDWDFFFDPKNVALDAPNMSVITTAQTFKKQGFKIFIFSGRLDNSKDVTIKWLKHWNVPFDKLQMRPDNKKDKFTPDDVLKQNWLNDLDKKDILCVFDDRQKVVDMWRANGIPCFQVAPGNF